MKEGDSAERARRTSRDRAAEMTKKGFGGGCGGYWHRYRISSNKVFVASFLVVSDTLRLMESLFNFQIPWIMLCFSRDVNLLCKEPRRPKIKQVLY